MTPFDNFFGESLMQNTTIKYLVNKFNILFCSLIFTIVASIIISNSAYAGVPAELHYMVSPPSCQPATSADRETLQLINGVWRIDSNDDNASALLICPVNFYGNTGSFFNLQLWYKANTASTNSLVRAILKSRGRSQSGSVEIDRVSTEDANNPGYGFVNKFIIGSAGPFTGRNYFVEVFLSRNKDQNSGDVAFVGLAIDIQ
jgi:hypothetical protein